jgi:hypothetical protein
MTTSKRARKREFAAVVEALPTITKVVPPPKPRPRHRRSQEAAVRCQVYLDPALHKRLVAFCERSHCWSLSWAVVQMIEHCLDDAEA